MCQKKVQEVFENIFGKWAEIVVKRTWIVFLVSLLVFIALCKSPFFICLLKSNSLVYVTYRRWNELIERI